MVKLLGKTPQELSALAVQYGLKPFAGRQMAQWLYEKKVRSFDAMTNLPKDARAVLKQNCDLGVRDPEAKAVSSDGTVKYLFRAGKSFVESVVIPDADRRTLCVSSQAGCGMNCRFCMTGRGGFHAQLDAADILNQFVSVDDAAQLTNAVFMGMGEPLANYPAVSQAIDVLTAPWGFAWSPKRITLSTIGVMPMMERYLNEHRSHLAVSLHNPFSEERAELMPVERTWPIADVVSLIRRYDWSGQRRVSFEYTMFAGWNDTKRHADALIRLLKGMECRVNLIRFHSIPDFPFGSSSQAVMESFRDRLNRNGLTCTIRASRGEDIAAACGLLAGRAAGTVADPGETKTAEQ